MGQINFHLRNNVDFREFLWPTLIGLFSETVDCVCQSRLCSFLTFIILRVICILGSNMR